MSDPSGSGCKFASHQTHTGSFASPEGIERMSKIVFPIPRDAVTNGNGDTTTVSRCTNFDTF